MKTASQKFNVYERIADIDFGDWKYSKWLIMTN